MNLSTGIEPFDRTLGGGITSGSLVVLTAAPQTQVNPLLHAGIHERPTLYFSTMRDESSIREEFDRLLTDPQLKAVRYVGVDSALMDILSEMETLGSGEGVLVSVLDPLESATSQNEYISFLNQVSERLHETDSIGIFHCLETEEPPAKRKFTLAAADFVWQLFSQRTGSKLRYTLEIPKASGLNLDETERVLTLKLGEGVSVDTSRDIA